MCGIIGYIGRNIAVPYLIDGLEKLEYRGYDSAGIALMESDDISIIKTKGRLAALESLIASKAQSKATIGIGHTRWATHGEPNDINSHPHLSQSGLFAVVHNGIIENYASLRESLQQDGYVFKSETDTEVIAHLLEKNYDGDLVSTVSKTTDMLEGAYALGILCKDFPDKTVCTRWASPLVLGKSVDGCFIASDMTAILKYTNELYKLGGREIAILDKDGISFYDKSCKPIKKESEHISWSISDAQKSGYEHFMLKEIMQQPQSLRDTIHPRIKNGKEIVLDGLNLSKDIIKNYNKIFITACGSAYHVGVVAKYVIEQMTKIPTEVDIASEFRYRDPIVDEYTLVIIISQSGETADTLAALRTAKEKGARILSIVNVVGSSIACESDDVLYTWAGPEIAVATTKAYSTQLAMIYLLAAHIAHQTGKMSDEQLESFLTELAAIPDKIETILKTTDAKIKQLAKIFIPLEHSYFIGRNLDYACAMEASLKMKEISYIHSEAYGAGELKHGTISLIEVGTLVVALAANDAVFAKTISNIKEVKARGARVLAVTTEKHRDEVSDMEYSIILPDTDPLLMPSLEVIPMQLLSYYASKLRGCDIDKPRNLAKSVTVE
ncbi:MAG: glutamine--fructose-6-phosphate transaminase (isomerizing) [Faecalibacterium sp.]|nr:glutamine--fructose-6-phosphate transaminase (isomerizing) [Ruminococcus sp.]MCM1392282.1 glutamine--fructose-6-phosphate transaminase (isomerizing) [Ruminococcus sp.]MCM1486555.1 glutamine--fructose-6-phosphate transaminase (isomerizing) [Faecalibacterium sp.]